MTASEAGPDGSELSERLGPLPTVARLYYTGVGSRRYKRASVRNGPGEALCFKSLADERVRQAVALARADERRLCIAELKRAATSNRTVRSQDAAVWAVDVLKRA